MNTKTTAIVVAVLVLVVALAIWISPYSVTPPEQVTTGSETSTATSTSDATQPDEKADEQPAEPAAYQSTTEIGKSVDGKNITAYHFGTGDTELVFVGGIHGGYSWNTAKVAYEMIDYLEGNEGLVPDTMRVTVIPVLNPDGLADVAGTYLDFKPADITASQTALTAARFNSNNVDLNRNFGCDWKSEAVWQSKKVSGGSAAFSEPETQAFVNYVENNKPDAVVVWYSAAGGVYASNCHGDVLEDTTKMADVYGKAAGYSVYKDYNFYETTGDMANWLASENIPAISVLLTTHTSTEWTKNRAGIDALIKYYAAR